MVWEKGPVLFFCRGIPSFVNNFYWRDCFFFFYPLYILGHFVENQLTVNVWVNFRTLYFVPLIDVPICMLTGILKFFIFDFYHVKGHLWLADYKLNNNKEDGGYGKLNHLVLIIHLLHSHSLSYNCPVPTHCGQEDLSLPSKSELSLGIHNHYMLAEMKS